MGRKQVIRREAILVYSTFQSQKVPIIANSEEEKDNNSFSKSAIDNNYPLSNQLIPSLAILK